MVEQQLAILNFNNLSVQIYGTEEEPQFSCKEILCNLLEYKQECDARWFRQMREDSRFVDQGDSPADRKFTEIGLYKALMKSNKPIAEEFQLKVAQFLKQIRQNMKQLIIEQKREIEYFNSLKKIGFIYKFQHKFKQNKFYIGLTEYPLIEMRFKDHKETGIQSLKLQLYREIFKEGLKNYEIIELERVEYIDWQELKQREDYWIDTLKPPLNNGYYFKCPCGVERKQHITTKTHEKQCLTYKQFKKGQIEPTCYMI